MKLHPFEKGKNPMLVLLKLLLTVYLGVLLVLWLVQEVLLFPGLWLFRGQDLDSVPWAERVDVDGVPYLLAHPEFDRVVVVAHGNAMWAGQMEDYARVLNHHGWSVAAFEFRGFAGAPGWPTEAGLAADLKTVLKDLESKGYPADRVVLQGISIGGGVVGTALDTKPAGLVLESTFDSLEGVVRDRWIGTLVPLSLLLRSPMRTGDRIRKHQVPVFRVHDTTDTIVDFSNAVEGPTVEAMQTTGLGHGNPLVLVVPEVRAAWLAWLEARVPAR